MDLSTHIRDIWIAVGVLSALGILLAFIQTSVWQSRSGKEIIDLVVCIDSNMIFVFKFNIDFAFRLLENYSYLSLIFLQQCFSLLWLVFLSGG